MPELFQRILLPVDFAPVSREAFLLGLRLAHQFHAQVFLLHVIDTKSLDALNALGLALPSEEKAQKKRLNHHARFLARGLLSLPETKGLKITRKELFGKKRLTWLSWAVMEDKPGILPTFSLAAPQKKLFGRCPVRC
jgi:hypothetical protein